MEFYHENDTAIFRIDQGIFMITFSSGAILNRRVAQLVTNIRIGMQRDRALPVFYNVDGILDSDKPGRDYLAQHASLLAAAVGICATRPVSKVIAQFILSISRHTVPVKIFRDKTEALEFLNAYR
jgi:hypothetical protein